MFTGPGNHAAAACGDGRVSWEAPHRVVAVPLPHLAEGCGVAVRTRYTTILQRTRVHARQGTVCGVKRLVQVWIVHVFWKSTGVARPTCVQRACVCLSCPVDGWDNDPRAVFTTRDAGMEIFTFSARRAAVSHAPSLHSSRTLLNGRLVFLSVLIRVRRVSVVDMEMVSKSNQRVSF